MSSTERSRAAGGTSRGTIFLRDAEVLAQHAHPGDQYILRLRLGEAARTAQPGTFAHVRCDASVPMRRPLSIMRADAGAGWLEFLYRPKGRGLAELARKRPGDVVSVLAPIGNGFRLDAARPRLIAIGGGVGIPPMIFQAERLAPDRMNEAVVLMGSEVPFPFELVPASLPVAGIGGGATHGLKLLEGLGVRSRLASNAGLPGSFAGFVTDLARALLEGSSARDRGRTEIVACGPGPMLRAAAALAAEFDVPCQLALEEYMACGVGGCAGCTVLVHTTRGDAMKRVCVDGPVFDAREIYP
jgi:dihydroorotate dehydrogenase electron transfer subunit